MIERIQRRAQRKERSNALDNLAEPPALVIGERLAAAPPSQIAANFSRRSSTSALIAAAFAANISERRSSEVVRTVIGVGHLIIAGVKLETGPGFRYDPTRPSATAGSDWALIWLDTRLGAVDRILPIVDHPPEAGSTVMLGGYQRDHPLFLMADIGCQILGSATDGDGRPLIRHDCTGTSRVSGAPLLIEQNGKWLVAGIDVIATERGAAGGYAVVLDEARRRL